MIRGGKEKRFKNEVNQRNMVQGSRGFWMEKQFEA